MTSLAHRAQVAMRWRRIGLIGAADLSQRRWHRGSEMRYMVRKGRRGAHEGRGIKLVHLAGAASSGVRTRS
jgi:hypothetical protein